MDETGSHLHWYIFNPLLLFMLLFVFVYIHTHLSILPRSFSFYLCFSVGGCCRVGPEDIKSLRTTVDLFNQQNNS